MSSQGLPVDRLWELGQNEISIQFVHDAEQYMKICQHAGEKALLQKTILRIQNHVLSFTEPITPREYVEKHQPKICDPTNLEDCVIGQPYQLTEIVENTRVSSGDYFLVSTEYIPKDQYPVLGFAKNKLAKKAEVFLIEAHAQFGSPTWRRAFKADSGWEVYWPAGGRTWNHSFVAVEKI